MTNGVPAQHPAVRVLVGGEATGGGMAALQLSVGRGTQIPRHIHEREDEVVYVLEGHLTFDLDGSLVDAPAGACVFLPRGVEHTFRVESGAARLLVTLTPAGLEGYYRELDAADPADIERLVALAACYGITITGPGV